MTDLAEFLLARIADDEAVANLARPDDHLDTRDRSFLRVEKAHGYAHVAATSGRVLADCAAKRQIVESRAAISLPSKEIHDEVQRQREYVWKLLALPYADHPKYREEWKL